MEHFLFVKMTRKWKYIHDLKLSEKFHRKFVKYEDGKGNITVLIIYTLVNIFTMPFLDILVLHAN